MIMLDEFEHLYALESGNPSLSIERQMYIQKSIIASAASLGSGMSFQLTTTLCGSSAHLESLVKSILNAENLKKFPVAEIALPINSSKYPTMRVPPPLPHDVSAMETSIKTWMQFGALKLQLRNEQQQLPALASMLAFEFGTIPRLWKEPLSDLCDKKAALVLGCTVPEMFNDVFFTIMGQLVKNNKALLEDIEKSVQKLGLGGLQERMMELLHGQGQNSAEDPLPPQWWERVVGVHVNIIKEMMIRTLKPDKTPWMEIEVQRAVLQLVDSHYVLYDARADILYPMSMRNLLAGKSLSAATVTRANKEEESRESKNWWWDNLARSPNVAVLLKYLYRLSLAGVVLYAGSEVYAKVLEVVEKALTAFDVWIVSQGKSVSGDILSGSEHAPKEPSTSASSFEQNDGSSKTTPGRS